MTGPTKQCFRYGPAGLTGITRLVAHGAPLGVAFLLFLVICSGPEERSSTACRRCCRTMLLCRESLGTDALAVPRPTKVT
jgi:hypothetical protein